MITLSTKGRYGVRAMVELARHYGQGPLPIRNIADRQRIPVPYLEQLLVKLRRGMLVESVRGRNGGYVLGRPPDQISVGDVVRVLEGPISLCECVSPKSGEVCDMVDHCVTKLLWARMSKQIEEIFDDIRLHNLLAEAAYRRTGVRKDAKGLF